MTHLCFPVLLHPEIDTADTGLTEAGQGCRGSRVEHRSYSTYPVAGKSKTEVPEDLGSGEDLLSGVHMAIFLYLHKMEGREREKQNLLHLFLYRYSSHL